MYCNSDVSSRIEREMKEHGPYGFESSKLRLPQGEKNYDNTKLLSLFWEWLNLIKDESLSKIDL